jgi:hypothetical protein
LLLLKKVSCKCSYINAFRNLFPYVGILAFLCHLKIKTGLILRDLRIKTGLKFPLP